MRVADRARGARMEVHPRSPARAVQLDRGSRREERNVVDIETTIAERMRERLETLLHELEAGAPERGQRRAGRRGGATPAIPGIRRRRRDSTRASRTPRISSRPTRGSKRRTLSSTRTEVRRPQPSSSRSSSPTPICRAPEELLAEIARRDRRLGDVVKHRARVVAILEASDARDGAAHGLLQSGVCVS